jgi:hypothetical protein
VVTASVDEEQSAARDHLNERGWNKTHNVWVDADAMKAFHVDGLPTTYLIDPAGKIAPLDEEAGLEESLSKLLAAP